MSILKYALPFLLLGLLAGKQTFAQATINRFSCEDPFSLCTERQHNRSLDPEYKGRYIGHDEPALLFYSDVKGSGNHNVYNLVLPVDPPTFPTDANLKGTGGPTVWNFQLHPAFWFGMALCDSESFPNFRNRCIPDSDDNIFDDGSPHSPRYIGHPLNNDPNKFAVLPGETFLMNPGDSLRVTIRDTEEGLLTMVEDLTTGQTGFMTASVANGFAQIVFNPHAPTCTSHPYAYHPMYATSNEHTRVPWAAHTFNVAFSDEIGHYNYCDAQDNSIIPGLGACISSPVETETDPKTGKHNEVDDLFCVDTASSVIFGSIAPLGGCLDSDVDFDGIPYHNAWAGTVADPFGFSAVPSPIRFTSPKFKPFATANSDELQNFSRVAFEADIPAIEDSSVCDVLTGKGCMNPPPGALFYPTYSTTSVSGRCWWQFGGPMIPGTTNNFGGSSATEYGTLLGSVFQSGTTRQPGSVVVFLNFRQILSSNPCD